MDDYHKMSNTGQSFVHRTLGKLLNAQIAPILHHLNLHKPEIVLELSKCAQILELSLGTNLPTHNRGIFIVLKG